MNTLTFSVFSKKFSSPSVITFAISFFWLLLFLFSEWPGFYSWDGLSYLNYYTNPTTEFTQCFNSSESYVYACPLFLFARYFHHFGWHLVLQCSVVSLVLSATSSLLARLTQRWTYSLCPLFLFLIFPLHWHMAIFTERDILFSWLSLLSVIFCFELYYFKDSGGAAIGLGFLSWLLPSLRHEGLLLFPIGVFLFFCYFKKPKKISYIFYLSSAATVIAFFLFLPKILQFESSEVWSRGYRYTLQSELNLFQFLDENRKDKRQAWETEIIGKVFDESKMMPFDFERFNASSIIAYKLADVSQFHKYIIHLIWNHPIEFIKYRYIVMQKTLSQVLRIKDYYDEELNKKFVYVPKAIENYNTKLPLISSLVRKYFKLTFNDLFIPLFWHIYTGCILVFILLFLVLFKKWRHLAILNLYPCLMWVGVFLTLPMPSQKYFYFSLVLFLFMAPLLVYEFFNQHQRSL